MKIVSSVTFDDEYKILKTESRIMVNSLRILKMPLFLGSLRDPFKILFNDDSLEEELLEYSYKIEIKYTMCGLRNLKNG